jgi:hypothetical protein
MGLNCLPWNRGVSLMLAVGRTALSLVISLTLAPFIANAAEIDGFTSVPRPQCIQLGCDEDTPTEIDPLTAADLLAFAEMGRDRCGLSPFAAWSLVGRYHLRWRDFRVGVEHAGERSGEGMIGPNFQLLLDAEDATARMFSLRGTPEACQLLRDALAKYVRIND